MKTGILTEILFLKKMRQIALEKNLGYKFDTSKENYNAYYEIGRILIFICELKNKELEKKEKRFLKGRIDKELLDYMSSISKPLKHVKYFIIKDTALNIKNTGKQYVKKKMKLTFLKRIKNWLFQFFTKNFLKLKKACKLIVQAVKDILIIYVQKN